MSNKSLCAITMSTVIRAKIKTDTNLCTSYQVRQNKTDLDKNKYEININDKSNRGTF